MQDWVFFQSSSNVSLSGDALSSPNFDLGTHCRACLATIFRPFSGQQSSCARDTQLAMYGPK